MSFTKFLMRVVDSNFFHFLLTFILFFTVMMISLFNGYTGPNNSWSDRTGSILHINSLVDSDGF